MIEFSGEFSEECKKHILKNIALIGFISALIPTVLFSIPVIIGIFMWDWIFVVALPVLIAIPIVAAASPFIYKEKTLNAITPKKISIDERGSVRVELEKHIINKAPTSIKKVIDNGEWYEIILRFPKIDGFICQKNLIKTGTLEEFEKFFEDKVERKIQKVN